MLRKNLAVEDVTLLPPGRGFLLCEFGAHSEEEVEDIVERFIEDAMTFPEEPVIARYTAAEAGRVWKVRESAIGASVFVPGERSGWEGWEDSAVPPEKLGAYLRELFRLIDAYGYSTPMYGHFGQGAFTCASPSTSQASGA
jgi:FAD/FMN-containing dehydrogenase